MQIACAACGESACAATCVSDASLRRLTCLEAQLINFLPCTNKFAMVTSSGGAKNSRKCFYSPMQN